MANTIKLKRSSTASNVPTTGQLELGEIAINTYDGKLFIKKNDGVDAVVEIGAGGGASELSDLSDVNTSTPTNRFVLIADGVDFESRLLVEADIPALTSYVEITGDAMTGTLDMQAYSEKTASYGTTGAQTLDTSAATYFYPTATTTGVITFTFSSPAAANLVTTITVELEGAANNAPVWPGSVIWQGGVEPTWTADTDLITFMTRDNGTTWTGLTVVIAASEITMDNFTDITDYTSGTTTALTLSINPGSENNIIVSFDGISQHHDTFSVSGTVLTFTTAIPLGTDDVEVTIGSVLEVSVPADLSVSTGKLVDGSVTEPKLATDAVTTIKINALAVTEAKIGALAVTEAKIGALAVTEAKIGALAVTVGKIGALAVTDAKLATDAVTTIKIADGNVTDVKLATDAVTTIKIADGNVTDAKLATDSVTTVKIDALAVTDAELATDSVTTSKIKNIDLVNLVYPVGAIYMSTVNTSPGTFLGGTWSSIQGRTLFAEDGTTNYVAGNTGGSKNAVNISHGHTDTFAFSGNALPTHRHIGGMKDQRSYGDNYFNYGGIDMAGSALTSGATSLGRSAYTQSVSAGTPSGTVTGAVTASGATGTNLNMHPYLAVYMWKRIS